MNVRKMILLSATVMMLSSAGCFSIFVRKAGSVAFGEKSSTLVLQLSAQNPKEFRYVEVAPLTSELGAKLPPTLLNDIRVGLIKQINENENTRTTYTAGDAVREKPALVVEGVLYDLEKGSRVQRAATIGGTAFLIARYTVKDKATGETLAVFNSRGFLQDSLYFGGDINNAVHQLNLAVIDYLLGKLHEKEKNE